jgi:hypothetical protein
MNEVVSGLVLHGSPVLVAWYGVYQINAGHLTVGELMQFLLYLAIFLYAAATALRFECGIGERGRCH